MDADLEEGPGADPPPPWAADSEIAAGSAEGGRAMLGNSSRLRTLYLFSSWSSEWGEGGGVGLPRPFLFILDHDDDGV